MSDQLALRQDLQALTSAIAELTLVTRALLSERGGRVSSESYPAGLIAPSLASASDWELVQDGTSIPGSPADFLKRPVVVRFEEGPPDTPDFCIQLARRHLSSSKASAGDRAREAYKAGFWPRAFWTCHTPYSSSYQPGVNTYTQWVLKKGEGFNFVRVGTQAESDRLQAAFSDIIFAEKLPTLAELHIFCAGASIPVPPLWRSTERR